MGFSEPAGVIGGIKFKQDQKRDSPLRKSVGQGEPNAKDDSWDLTHLNRKLQRQIAQKAREM